MGGTLVESSVPYLGEWSSPFSIPSGILRDTLVFMGSPLVSTEAWAYKGGVGSEDS